MILIYIVYIYIMTLKQNINELNVIMKNGSKANLDKIKNVLYLHVDRTIVNFRTARHIVVQLAHPTKQNINRAGNNIIMLLLSILTRSQRQGA